MSENDSVLVSHFGSDDVSKFQPAEASYQIHEAWEESGSPGSEGRFGVFAVSSLFAVFLSFDGGCFHHVFFLFSSGEGWSCDGQNVQDVQQHQFVVAKTWVSW